MSKDLTTMRVIIKPKGLLVLFTVLFVVIAVPWYLLTRKQSLTAATVAPPVDPRNILLNTSMSETDAGTIKNWTEKWTEGGDVRITQDNKVFHSAPASLRIEPAKPGKIKGQIGQLITGNGGQQVKLHGWMKTDVSGLTMLIVVPLDADWKVLPQLKWAELHEQSDWMYYQKTITLPPGTAHCTVALYIDGEGQAWVDDVMAIPE